MATATTPPRAALRLPRADPKPTGWRRLVPTSLLANDDDAVPRSRVDRTRKDWLLDAMAIGAAAVAGIVIHVEAVHAPTDPGPLLMALDLVLLPVGLLALLWRRRWPLHVAVLLAVIAVPAPSTSLAGLIAVFAVAAYSRPSIGLLGIGIVMLPAPFVAWLWPTVGDSGADASTATLVNDALFGVIITAGIGAWGLFAGARRQLVATLRDRATRAEAEQHLRVAQAREQERTRIAREMHDVLAHRMSLLSVHAGALEFRPDAPPEEVARAAGVIRATAHEALEELRTVIGVLRVSDSVLDGPPDVAASGGVPEAPQPTLGAVPQLVEEWRGAGARIELTLAASAVADLPPTIGRTAYRIVQEALTNAGKHAPTARVVVVVEGHPGDSLVVSVSNPMPVGEAAAKRDIPGTGIGLIGLRERTELVGGAFAAGFDEDLQRFVVEARLPWSAT